MAKRVGLWTLQTLAEKMCKAIVKFTPLIEVAFPNDDIIGPLLVAANSACAALASHIRTINPPTN